MIIYRILAIFKRGATVISAYTS